MTTRDDDSKNVDKNMWTAILNHLTKSFESNDKHLNSLNKAKVDENDGKRVQDLMQRE